MLFVVINNRIFEFSQLYSHMKVERGWGFDFYANLVAIIVIGVIALRSNGLISCGGNTVAIRRC